ncbi:PREDICTED: T-cell surface glycoprotein CD8 beta chain isoform X1 [Pseudopodoces humilis]|uniref:T-cell surface glycoprotein CD8 beta chain isoform X1 n=1 Tax=Pseudopodoces humilis TaxID=181119 RepID=UPI0006B6E593|nr:PREDICTED: T-cell surface glycoprotein CD8 beta chain isoform X1 [Pseudopodoces humilis]
MVQPWLHLCICLQIPGFYTLLTQTPEHLLTQTNSKTEMLCEVKKEHTGVYWYRWSQERQRFEFLVFSNMLGKATYGTNVSRDKFSVHEARAHSSYSLHISHLHPSDSGTYYCSISQSSQLLLGSGTQLRVADTLPLPPKTTQTPVSKKPVPRITKSKAASRTGPCSPLVWIPLAAGVLLLLLGLVPAALRLHREYPATTLRGAGPWDSPGQGVSREGLLPLTDTVSSQVCGGGCGFASTGSKSQ